MRQQHNVGRTASPARLLLCCATFALLQACPQGGPDTPFENYLGRLGAALSVAAPERRPTAAPPLPDAQALQVAIPPGNIDRLDILQLSGCAVQANIGKRQTSLGQAAKASQRLLLELEYLRLAPQCIRRLRKSNHDALASRLQATWLEKQAQLPALIFNATLGSDEYRAFWRPVPTPGEYPRIDPELAASALEAINQQTSRWMNGDYRAHNGDFELLLSEVAGGDGGTQLQDWTHQIDWLATADQMVEQRLAQGALCGGHNSSATTLTALARGDFYDVIQILTLRSQHRYRKISAPIAELEAQLYTALPQRYYHWMKDREQQVAILAGAPGRHLGLLSRIQQTCTTDGTNRAHST